MDYSQTKEDAFRKREELLRRQEAIASEKDQLNKENGEIERQLLGLDEVLEGLEFLTSDVPPEEETIGFTERIRRILQRASSPLTAVEIRDILATEAANKTSQKTLLISVHTVLGRIASDLKKSEKNDKPAYIWKHVGRRAHFARPFRTGLHSAGAAALAGEPTGLGLYQPTSYVHASALEPVIRATEKKKETK